MENAQKEKYKIRVRWKYLLIGFACAGLLAYMIVNVSHFFWIMLPFTFTFLALGIDAL